MEQVTVNQEPSMADLADLIGNHRRQANYLEDYIRAKQGLSDMNQALQHYSDQIIKIYKRLFGDEAYKDQDIHTMVNQIHEFIDQLDFLRDNGVQIFEND